MSEQVEAAGEAVADSSEAQVSSIPRVSQSLYFPIGSGGASSLTELMKAEEVPKNATSSSQGVATGRKGHPFNFEMAGRFQSVNVHHGRSIHTKVAATVGLGFESPNDRKRKQAKALGTPLGPDDLPPADDVALIDTKLDPLCEHSWHDAISDVCEDYWQTGNGYLEIVRSQRGGEVIGIYHLPAKEAYVVIEDHRYRRHYSIQGGEDSTGSRVFARFGDLDDFLRRAKGSRGVTFDYSGALDPDAVSEVIHFRRPTSLSRWYGYPDWLSCVAAIELVQCLTQHEYDFFLNRGVPEFMLFILGQGLNPKDKERIESAMQSTIGLGNQHKSLLVNLPNGGAEMQVILHKLAMESKSDGSQFAGMAESLALQIVSSHGVPSLLAGIQVPGKLGAANEMVQAMQSFQTLVIGPAQRLFRQTLMNTLGKEPSLGLSPEDLVLNSIVDDIDVKKADTMARMRQSPQEAEAEGRDLEDGVKKEWTDEERGELIREGMNALIDRIVGRAA
jgi:hypothetical protein